MKLLPCALAFSSALLLPACSGLSLSDLTGGLPGQSSDSGAGSMVDAMQDQPAMNVLVLPPEPAVGQAWTLTMTGGFEQRTAIVAERDGQFLVEQPMDMGGPIVVQAFLVDPSIDLGRVAGPGDLTPVNVTAAWVAAEGVVPVERAVMDAFEIPAATGETPPPTMDFEQGTERIEIAGRTWDAQWTETGGSRTWVIAGGTFLLRSSTNGETTMELTAFETDAKPTLQWKAGE